MKTSIFILKFYTFFILAILINSCSKDENSIHCVTFLECQEGTVWKDNSSSTDEIVYIRFINNPIIIFEVFNQFIPNNKDCFTHYNISQGWGEINIIENTENKLDFVIFPPDWELNTVEFKLSKSEDTLHLSFNIYDEYGALIKSNPSILIKSIINVDELPSCKDI